MGGLGEVARGVGPAAAGLPIAALNRRGCMLLRLPLPPLLGPPVPAGEMVPMLMSTSKPAFNNFRYVALPIFTFFFVLLL